MGRDKALLPHPEGGTWLSRSLLLLEKLDAPITLLSRWPAHLALAEALAVPSLSAIAEQPPWEGPLLALHRLMELHPCERLLLCPVDMPNLSLATLQTLLMAAAKNPKRPHLAHDGQRLQPLLGLYPSSAPISSHLAAVVERGERRLQHWLTEQPHQAVLLDPHTIRNVNRPEADQPGDTPSITNQLDRVPSIESRHLCENRGQTGHGRGIKPHAGLD